MLSRKLTQSLLILTPIGLLAGCFDNNSNNDDAPPPSRISLAVTDAPVDNARHVVVEFSAVVLQPSDQERIEIRLEEPVRIDLLSLQGQVSQYLVLDEEIPPGDYDWLRLAVNASLDGTMDSYIELDNGSQLELVIPSGAESGLKLTRGFVLQEGGEADFTIDFDLRRSVIIPSHTDVASAVLKPTLRITDTVFSGSIEGEIDALLVAGHCTNPDLEHGAVYLFDHTAEPNDVFGDSQGPMISAMVHYNEAEGSYSYEAGFVPAGTYNVFYTCDAHLDSPETDDDLTLVPAGAAPVTLSLAENLVLNIAIGDTDPRATPTDETPKPDENGGPEEDPEAPVDTETPAEEEPNTPETGDQTPEPEAPAPQDPPVDPATPSPEPEDPGSPEAPEPTPEQPAPAPEKPAPTPEQPAPVPEQPAPAPEQPAPAPEQPAPTPEQPAPAPEQPAPTPEQPAPAPEQPVPAPEQPAPAPEQPAPAPEQPAPAPEQPAPAPEQPAPTPEQPAPAPEEPVPAPEQPTPAPEQPAPAPEQPAPAPEPTPTEPEAPTDTPETDQPSQPGGNGGKPEQPGKPEDPGSNNDNKGGGRDNDEEDDDEDDGISLIDLII